MEFFLMLTWLTFLVIFIYFFCLKWNEIRYKRKGLPPGTMGWPVFGETIKFLRQGPKFMTTQRARYGNVFKSHILGSPTVISMDPELNRYILLNEAKGLVPGYPQSILDILGEHNIGALSGLIHKQIRGTVMLLLGPSAVKDRLIPKIDKYLSLYLQNWNGKTIDIQERTKDMAFFMSIKLVMEEESSLIYDAIKAEFDKLVEGTLSLPINLPGTKYYQGFRARKNVIKILREILKNRRASSMTQDDMLNSILTNAHSRYEFSDEEIYDQIIMILDSGYETVSTTTMMAIKYLHDHPEALQELREEHFMIRKEKSEDQGIDLNDYKTMRFTRAVIFEAMRLATVVNGVLRKTKQDLELNGYVIPKGWRIYVYTREINYNSDLYPEAFKFNPWRWLEKGLESHNYFFLFGGGSRLCPGKELGIVTISIFLHYFVTRYRWEEIGGEEIHQFPRVEAPKGLHMKVFKY